MAIAIFRKSLMMEKQTDEFLDQVSESALLLQQGVKGYLAKQTDLFQETLTQITKNEQRGDKLRREIERELYVQTLIPESRGDVLELLENMDKLIGLCKGTLWQFAIQKPVIPEKFHFDLSQLIDFVILSVENLVITARSFMKNLNTISEHMHKVAFYEHEADKMMSRLTLAFFEDENLDLSQKMHLRYFIDHIDRIADEAEDIAERVTIYAIKRSI